MAQPNTHIVYRNRVEHDFYESGMMIPLISGLGVGVLVFLALCKFFERTLNRSNNGNILMAVIGILSLGTGGMTFHWLML